MKEKFIQVVDHKLFYLEVNEESKNIIFFIHGNSGSSNTWLQQLENQQLKEYRLIAFDLPGHGRTEHKETGYKSFNLIDIGETLSAAVKILAGSYLYILAGYSLGTNVIGEMLSYDLKPNGIVLISPCIIRDAEDLKKVFLPNPYAGCFFKDDVNEEELTNLADNILFTNDSELHENYKNDFRTTRASFRSDLLKTTSEGMYSNEVEAIQHSQKPVLIIFGNKDKLVNTNYLENIILKIWNNTIYKINNAGHAVHADAPEDVNLLVAEYASDVFFKK